MILILERCFEIKLFNLTYTRLQKRLMRKLYGTGAHLKTHSALFRIIYVFRHSFIFQLDLFFSGTEILCWRERTSCTIVCFLRLTLVLCVYSDSATLIALKSMFLWPLRIHKQTIFLYDSSLRERE